MTENGTSVAWHGAGAPDFKFEILNCNLPLWRFRTIMPHSSIINYQSLVA
jgi:hypothetical protein